MDGNSYMLDKDMTNELLEKDKTIYGYFKKKFIQ
jgi:hypothetical protein